MDQEIDIFQQEILVYPINKAAFILVYDYHLCPRGLGETADGV